MLAIRLRGFIRYRRSSWWSNALEKERGILLRKWNCLDHPTRHLSGTTDKFISHGAEDITEAGYKSCSARLMPAGSVLFNSRAPIGHVAIASGNVTTNQGFKSIIPKKEIGTAFTYYFLLRNKQRISDMDAGTTFPEVSAKMMQNRNDCYPCIQRRGAQPQVVRRHLDALERPSFPLCTCLSRAMKPGSLIR